MTDFYKHEECLWYYSHKPLFWVLMSMMILIALVGVLGNAMVIYFATQKDTKRSGFRYLNYAVNSLAITDFCLSLFGTPAIIVYWYWGRYSNFID